MKVYDQSVQASVLWCIAILLMNYFYAWLLWKLNKIAEIRGRAVLERQGVITRRA